jgi:hypothetical protein
LLDRAAIALAAAAGEAAAGKTVAWEILLLRKDCYARKTAVGRVMTAQPGARTLAV